MALTNIIRRTASRVVPLVAQVIGRTQGCRHHRSFALFSTIANRSAASRNFFHSLVLSTLHCYSTKRPSFDESLIKVIQSEILCAESVNEQDEVDKAAPEGFPFKIEHHPGQQTITLTREYQGESIVVEVHMPDLISGSEDENDGNAEDDRESGNQSQIPLVIRVSRKNGLSLEFSLTAYDDEILIESLSIKDPKVAEDHIAYEGPDFSRICFFNIRDLDENLQKAFHKYLEIKGFKPSTTNFLHEYMINKDTREYVMWLKNLKKFIDE
ncbi:putative CASP-like protein [Capsicum annuum]|nr:putative CASP-like protein [Capsicum annuum]